MHRGGFDYHSLNPVLSLGNASVKKAQGENRRLGIPNYYSINGVIVSDQQLTALAKKRNSFIARICGFFKN
jgi:hypothetical protein